MAGIDLATGMLIGGILVLCATTAVTALTLPSFGLRRRRRRFRYVPEVYGPIQRTSRPALALGVAPRPPVAMVDDRRDVDDVDTAWTLIEQMLEHHPERLVAVLTEWITDDLTDTPDDRPHQRKAAP